MLGGEGNQEVGWEGGKGCRCVECGSSRVFGGIRCHTVGRSRKGYRDMEKTWCFDVEVQKIVYYNEWGDGEVDSG